MKKMKLLSNMRLRRLCLGLLSWLVVACPAAFPAPEAGLRALLLQGQWTWDARSSAYPPVVMEFREDGNGGTERFTYEWTVTGPKSVTLKMQNKGKLMNFVLEFDDALANFKAAEVNGGTRAVGYRRPPTSTPPAIAAFPTIKPAVPVASTPASPIPASTPARTPIPLPIPVSAPSTPAPRPATPPPITTVLATTPRPGPTPSPRAAPVTGFFHVFIDDTVSLYLNSREILNIQNRVLATRTREVELKPGDHLVARLINTGGPRAFVISFASADMRQAVHFGNMDFHILPRPDANDFTAEEYRSARLSEQDHGRKDKPPFPFRTRSEWIWGKSDGCTIGATITADMFQSLQR